MKMRRWQLEAVTKCVSQFHNGQNHFLCLATPGAGKTYMASKVTKQLLNSGDIDLVFCFSPSINVSQSFRKTLETVLSLRLDGLLGSKGNVLTYQSMLSLPQTFWMLLETHRTLVIFDEIHHCAGNHLGNANAWGQKIINHIQGKATFTLALTGTPWRSDRVPIALTSYCQEGKVHCDYAYGLAQALKDQVCRVPKIISFDNERISVRDGATESTYRSIGALLRSSGCTYQQLLENVTLIRYLMEQSHKTLSALRRESPNAGGLIVAASVEHAQLIAEILEEVSGENPAIVTYLHGDSQRAIKKFRDGFSKWIVSVGMISEGTDIPRLQVCCHLTRVKTELYFRQVLGRILRVQKGEHQSEAFLIMPAEPKLLEYAERVAEDIPTSNTISKKKMNGAPIDWVVPDDSNDSNGLISDDDQVDIQEPTEFRDDKSDEESLELSFSGPSEPISTPPYLPPAEAYETTLGLFGRFRKRMINIPTCIQ